MSPPRGKAGGGGAGPAAFPGSEPEDLRHPLGQVSFGHRGVDLDSSQAEALGLLAEEPGEHVVTLQQVPQRPLRIAGLAGDRPQRAPAGERGPPEPGRRQKPDSVARGGQQRFHQARQQPEALGDHTRFRRETQEVVDDQTEQLPLEPVKALQHGLRGSAYDTGKLAADIRGLIQERGAKSALLVGHDWGGTIAWATAMHHPEVVDQLAILNAAHPRKLSQGLHHPGQLRKSWYFFFFDLPELPETVVHANHWHFFRHFLRDAHPAYTPEETERYIEAWSQPGAAAGMINYYRSSVRTPPKKAEAALRPIKAPTLVIWGERDRYLGPELAEPEHDDVPNLEGVERLTDASHWVHHDEHERVNQMLIDFFAPARPATT